jgi:hypothetical protein
MSKAQQLTWDRLPLFANDDEIGEAMLGWDRRREFHGLATLHERNGMPKISAVWGGRYVPAVKAFLDSQYGLSAAAPVAPDGMEGKYNANTRRTATKPRTEVAEAPTRGGRPLLVR